nr:hypothetical protein [Nocardioides sp. Root190]
MIDFEGGDRGLGSTESFDHVHVVEATSGDACAGNIDVLALSTTDAQPTNQDARPEQREPTGDRDESRRQHRSGHGSGLPHQAPLSAGERISETRQQYQALD